MSKTVSRSTAALNWAQENRRKIGIGIAGLTLALLGGAFAAYFAHPGAHALSATIERLALPVAWSGMVALPLAIALNQKEANLVVVNPDEKQESTHHKRNFLVRVATMVALTAGAVLACHVIHLLGHKLTPLHTLTDVGIPLVATVVATNIALARWRPDTYNCYNERLS